MTGTFGAADRAAFRAGWLEGRAQVLLRRLIDDVETPVSAFLKVGRGRTYALLLESVEGGSVNGRYSIIAREPDLVWRCRAGQAETARGPAITQGVFEADDLGPLDSLRAVMTASRLDLPGDVPPMASGLFGVFGYDMVRFLEPLGPAGPDPLELPDAVLTRPGLVAVFDSVRHEIILASAAYPDGGDDAETAFEAAQARLDAFERDLAAPLARPSARTPDAFETVPEVDQATFAQRIAGAKDYIAAGDIFQVVLSHRISSPWSGDPFAAYRALRRENPSPYLFFLDFGDFQLAGSSPEILVRLKAGELTIRPLAGTRPRGETPAQDEALEAELLADPKERAEHLMLLDLGRNDVGRAAAPGTVRVAERFRIERYSAVMHIVSEVRGQARADVDALEALLVALPAGTLSGAPKVRAMEIIDELEGVKRGVGYGGGVGYITGRGEADFCIVLRTALFTPGQAHVQAGAGVVADSDPAAEYAETLAKARSPLRALGEAWRYG